MSKDFIKDLKQEIEDKMLGPLFGRKQKKEEVVEVKVETRPKIYSKEEESLYTEVVKRFLEEHPELLNQQD